MRAGDNDTKPDRSGIGVIGGDASTPAGVTAPDAADAAPAPTVFEATTVNVYAVPFVNPDTVHDNAANVEHVAPPGADVTT